MGGARRAATSSRSIGTPASGSPDDAEGDNVQAEYIRDGQELMVGGYGQTGRRRLEDGRRRAALRRRAELAADRAGAVRGQARALPINPSLGSMSSGGLY